MKITHAQLHVMAEKTHGYSKETFSFWISAQSVVYLTVIHVVYCIDSTGNYVTRRKLDGALI